MHQPLATPTVATSLYQAGYTDLLPVIRPNTNLSRGSKIHGFALGRVPGKHAEGGWYEVNAPVPEPLPFPTLYLSVGKGHCPLPEAPPDKGGSVGKPSGTRTRLPTAGNGLVAATQLNDLPTVEHCFPGNVSRDSDARF